MTKHEEIRYLGDVQRLELQPGDVIVLSCAVHLSAAENDRIREVMKRFFPNHQVLILEGDVRIGVIGWAAADEFEVVTADGKVAQRITVD